jgi:hypothetical protein
VANSIASRTSESDLLQPKSTDVRNGMPAARNKDMGAKGPMTVSMVLLKKMSFITITVAVVNQSISMESRKSHNLSVKLSGYF